MSIRRAIVLLLAGFALWITTSCFLFTPQRGPVKLDPATLRDAQAGVPYEAKISISRNATPAIDFSISAGALPNGLKMEKVPGEDAARIFGTPQGSGTFKFTVFVWCYGTNVNGQTGEKEYTITVQ